MIKNKEDSVCMIQFIKTAIFAPWSKCKKYLLHKILILHGWYDGKYIVCLPCDEIQSEQRLGMLSIKLSSCSWGRCCLGLKAPRN